MKNYSRILSDLSRDINGKPVRWRFKLTRMGNIADVLATTLRKSRPQITTLAGKQYILHKTGEVKAYMPNDERNKRSLRKIFNDLRLAIGHNFYEVNDSKLKIELTYREEMRDENRLMSDFDAFKKRLGRYCKGHKLDYIAIVEPHKSGVWHIHLLLKSDQPLLVIHNSDMERLWGHGFTKTRRLLGKTDTTGIRDVNNIGAYFMAYFTGVAITDENKAQYDLDEHDLKEVVDKETGKPKKVIKGERLKYYPDYMQIWRHSRGIEKAPSEDTTKEAVLIGYKQPHWVNVHEVELTKPEAEPEADERLHYIVKTQHRKREGT